VSFLRPGNTSLGCCPVISRYNASPQRSTSSLQRTSPAVPMDTCRNASRSFQSRNTPLPTRCERSTSPVTASAYRRLRVVAFRTASFPRSSPPSPKAPICLLTSCERLACCLQIRVLGKHSYIIDRKPECHASSRIGSGIAPIGKRTDQESASAELLDTDVFKHGTHPRFLAHDCQDASVKDRVSRHRTHSPPNLVIGSSRLSPVGRKFAAQRAGGQSLQV